MQPPRKNPGLITLIAQAFKQWFMGLSGTGKAWVVGIGVVVIFGALSGPPNSKDEVDAGKPASKTDLDAKRSSLGQPPKQPEQRGTGKRTRSQYIAEATQAYAAELDAAKLAARGDAPKPSEWDGICPEVNRYLKATLNDPDFDLVKCYEVLDLGEYWGQMVQYRARNGFGAKVMAVHLFLIQHGEVVRQVGDVKEIERLVEQKKKAEKLTVRKLGAALEKAQQEADSMVRKGILVKD